MIDTRRINDIIQRSIDTKVLLQQSCLSDIERCGRELCEALKDGRKLLFCGNGGSAADAQHIAAELVIRFRGGVERRALPAMSLGVDPSLVSAGANDYGYENTFARAVEAFGQAGDVLIGISTSGNSINVLKAMQTARARGMKTVGLLGCKGGKMTTECDASVVVPSNITAHIQECHIMIGHIWCEMIEEYLFPELFTPNVSQKN